MENPTDAQKKYWDVHAEMARMGKPPMAATTMLILHVDKVSRSMVQQSTVYLTTDYTRMFQLHIGYGQGEEEN